MKMASLAILVPAAMSCSGRRSRASIRRAPAPLAQPRPARLLRDPLRVLVGRRQQRLGVRRPHRERHVLRDGDRDRMFVGRYWMIVPVLAIAGSLAAKKNVPADGGHAADPRAAVRRAARRHRAAGRRADVLPGARARPDRRAPAALHEVIWRRHVRQDPGSSAVRRPDRPARAPSIRVRKLDPRRMIRNPVMFVVEVGSAFTTLLSSTRSSTGHGEAPAGFILGRRGLAVVHRAVRELRRGDGRGPRQGAGRRAAQGAHGRRREAAARAAARRARSRRCRRRSCARATSCSSRRAT